MSDRVSYVRPYPDLLAVSGQQDIGVGHSFPIYEGLVIDVVLSHKKRGTDGYDTTDGYNYGTIKVRILEVSQTVDESVLDWANPIDNTVHAIPLIGELVTLMKIRGAYFYTTKVPMAHRTQENAFLNFNLLLNRRNSNASSTAAATTQEQTLDKHKFGSYWRPDSRVRQLLHFEGDTVIQGRMGHSIRFGSSAMNGTSPGLAPNIILRTGQAKDIEKKKITINSVFGAILEDINEDASSIWMVSDQKVPFEPTSIKSDGHYRSIKEAVQIFDGAQIIANSDRVILNSKKSHIMLFSNNEVYINSFGRTSIDSDESVTITAQADFNVQTTNNASIIVDQDFSVKAASDISLLSGEKISLSTNKIFLGSEKDDKEPVVGGTSLSKFLARLIKVLVGDGVAVSQGSIGTSLVPAIANTAHVITPMGPGLLNPAIKQGLQDLYEELTPTNGGSEAGLEFSGAVFNSEDVFVNLSNEDPSSGITKNEFKVGEQGKTENSTWVLTDSYYKVL